MKTKTCSPRAIGDCCDAIAPVVVRFSESMLFKLHRHHAKGDREGWAKEDPQWLLSRLLEETSELSAAINLGNPTDVRNEAADVANFAMMIADVCGGFDGPMPEVRDDSSRLTRIAACAKDAMRAMAPALCGRETTPGTMCSRPATQHGTSYGAIVYPRCDEHAGDIGLARIVATDFRYAAPLRSLLAALHDEEKWEAKR
jgi:hypothetical protein